MSPDVLLCSLSEVIQAFTRRVQGRNLYSMSGYSEEPGYAPLCGAKGLVHESNGDVGETTDREQETMFRLWD